MKEYNGAALLGYGEKDWFAGANSPVKRAVLMEDGDWKKRPLPNEIQVINYGKPTQYESMLCVSFNGVSDPIDSILNRQIELGIVPEQKVNWLKEWGYIVDGSVNTNERFVGTLGETTKDGAFVYKVADAARTFGMIPQKMFPFADNFNDNVNKKFITDEMYEIGAKFKELFKINYEWVLGTDTKEFLKYSPLGCVGRYGNMDGDEPIAPTKGGWHSMMLIKETDTYREVDDSYWQQFKKYKREALDSFMAFYIDASGTTMFDEKAFIKKYDKYIIRNTHTGAYGVIYAGVPLHIIDERAGVFMIDRDKRGLIGKPLTKDVTDDEWKELVFDKKF